MPAMRCPGWYIGAAGGLAIALLVAQLTFLAPPPEQRPRGSATGIRISRHATIPAAATVCVKRPRPGPAPGTGCAAPNRSVWSSPVCSTDTASAATAATAAASGTFPTCPISPTRWQASRPDQQLASIVMRGRGAVMPSFRRTLTLEEAWAMARFLRTFAPAPNVTSPDPGRSATARRGAAAATSLPPLPSSNGPATTLR
jgi:hypothetical protein